MRDDLFFRIAILGLLGGAKIVRGYYQKKMRAPGLKESLPRITLDTVLAFVFLGLVSELVLAVYILIPRWIEWAAIDLPNWLRIAGVLLGLAGLPFFVWAHRALGRNFSAVLRIKEDHQLVTDGPYRWIRHPIYTFGILLGIANFLVSANWFVGAGTLGSAAIVFSYRIPIEEAGLIEKLGESYRAYMKHTGRLLPKLWRG